ncbi:MAG TPA: hypothetical protein VMZ28_25505, partial [Kofleriaceae bacterium]|nr:hypothetical protein [Kofleriaceae bacterium]
WAAEGEQSSEPAESEDADIALPEAPAPKAKKVARTTKAAAPAADAEMSFEPVNLRKDDPKPQPKVAVK